MTWTVWLVIVVLEIAVLFCGWGAITALLVGNVLWCSLSALVVWWLSWVSDWLRESLRNVSQ